MVFRNVANTEEYWKCLRLIYSNPQNLLFIRHDPCGSIPKLNYNFKLERIV